MAAALVGVVSLVTTVFVAHVLTTEGYGTLVILLGLFLVVSLPGSAVLVGVVRRISAWDARDQAERAKAWAARVHRIAEVSLVAMAVVMWLVRVPVAHALGRPSATGVAEVLTAGGVWILVSIDRGLLQVRRSYLNLSINLVIEAATRCALTIGLAAEFGLEGAALGLLFGEMITAVHARVMSARSMAHPLPPAEAAALQPSGGVEEPGAVEPLGTGLAESVHGGRDLAADVFTALGSLALLALLQNLDVIILGKQAPHHSGAYAAISVPAKALVFGAITLSNYLLPEATIRHQRGSHALRQLGQTLAVLALPCGVLLLAALAVPHELLKLVFGAKYTAAYASFSTLVLATVLLSATVVMAIYLLGVGWRWVVVVLAAGTAALAGAVATAHGRYSGTARADLFVQIGLCAAMGVSFVSVHRRAVRSRVTGGAEHAPAPGTPSAASE